MASTADILDVLIVGGGPGGTAAAFRANELGLAARVVEYDDLMKRIRDYSKDKLILPGFGGGDQMRFPKGGDLVSCLCFEATDKDDLCAAWKDLYRRHGVVADIGVELTGLERRADGVWEVLCWSHAERCDAAYLARHVVLAIGRGVPRRFDIPGNTDGIALRLDDAAVYVGQPACVVGGGTSAAEAVIAISNAKAAAGDSTAVYWSYRGDKMPRVSKALAEVFFEAYVGNGNVRYCPQSEPASVVTGSDREEYLAIRVDRRRMDGRPAETTHLEFPKASVMACIGEDIPEALFASFGIPMAVGGPKRRKRMVVNRYLETAQPNVYLAGDILSQAYFLTDDFGADPALFREVRHRGNIKSALRDGVLVAQVIHQRLQGSTEIDVTVAEQEPREEPRAAEASQIFAFTHPAAGPAEDGLEPGSRAAEAAGFLVRMLPGGVEEDEHPVAPHSVVGIGRREGDLTFPDDTLLSDRHASVSHTADGCYLRDDGSSSGTFLEVPSARKIELADGDLLRAGRQFLLFAAAAGGFAFTHYDASGREIGRHALAQGTIVLGRKAPDVTLDPADTTLSRRHFALSVLGGSLLAKDLRSINGTYLRVRSAARLEPGDRFRVGQQTFAFTREAGAALDLGPAPAAGAPPSPAAVAGGATVTFRGLGKTLPVAAGQSICDAAEAHGVPINAECHSGICGSDPIRVVSGGEQLAAPEAGESETLEDICGLEPGPCRLACMVRIRGPVEVELL